MRLAIVGATGLVGETLIALLDEKNIKFSALYLIASDNSAGDLLECQNNSYEVENIAGFDFSKADVAIFSAGDVVSKTYAPRAMKAGCTVIDNSSAFRYDDKVPLIIPEVNGDLLKGFKKPGIIANPNCSTIQMLVAVKPLHEAFGLTSIEVATYQSVSGAGREALHELIHETASKLNGKDYVRDVFPKQIAFNAIPHIDEFQENGYTREEMKMVWETHKILADVAIQVNPTCVRVPVFYGHAEALHLRFKVSVTPDAARKLLKKAPGITVLDRQKAGGYPTSVGDASGSDDVFVGRIRQMPGLPNSLNLWVVADNLRKGAALNALQIMDCL